MNKQGVRLLDSLSFPIGRRQLHHLHEKIEKVKDISRILQWGFQINY